MRERRPFACGIVLPRVLGGLAMRYCVALAAFLFAAWIAAPAFAVVDLDQATKDYLEGSWAAADSPGAAACGTAATPHYQMDIEFRRSGGRVLDLTRGFPPVARSIIDAARNGDEISMTLGPLIGVPQVQEVLRIVSPKRVELRLLQYDNTPYEQYRMPLDRCLAPKRGVNDSISVEDLKVLSSIGKDIIVFKEAVSGLTDVQICSAKERGIYGAPGDTLRVDSLQFEVFGPVHYLIQGRLDEAAWKEKLRNAVIMTITSTGDGTLTFKLAEPTSEKDETSSRMPRHQIDFTTKWDGKRLYVSEIGKSFARCRVTSMLGSTEPAPLP